MNPNAVAFQLADIVKSELKQRDDLIASLSARLKALEDRPPPKDGKDGRDGEKGEKGDPGEVVTVAVDELALRVKALEDKPAPRDGRDGQPGPKGDPGERGYDGRDGNDGWSPDHVDFVMNSDGTGEFTMKTGDKVKTFPFHVPAFVDRGPYRESEKYLRGHGVTKGGDFWICQEDNPGPIGKDFTGWRLAVRKGRDARAKA